MSKTYIVLRDQFGKSRGYIEKDSNKLYKLDELEDGAIIYGYQAVKYAVIDMETKACAVNGLRAVYTRTAKVIKTERGNMVMPIYKIEDRSKRLRRVEEDTND